MKKDSFLGKASAGSLTAILIAALPFGSANADITETQSQAMAANAASETATFFLGILGACATTYPDTRADVLKAMQSMNDRKLEDKETSKIISSVGQCMNHKVVPTKSQCSDLAKDLPSKEFDPNGEKFAPMLMTSLEMLEPCRRSK